jgi:uncharacterized membrane protein
MSDGGAWERGLRGPSEWFPRPFFILWGSAQFGVLKERITMHVNGVRILKVKTRRTREGVEVQLIGHANRGAPYVLAGVRSPGKSKAKAVGAALVELVDQAKAP